VRFTGIVVFEGDDFATPLELHQQAFEDEGADGDEDEPTGSRRCSCTWQRAAQAASEGYKQRLEAVLGEGSSRGRGLFRRREQHQRPDVLDLAKQADQLWQQRMYAMVSHPEYGRPDPACPECSGAGRVDDYDYPRFDYFSEPEAGRWSEVLVTPCRTPSVWPWGDDLSLAFRMRFRDEAFPPFAQIHPPGVLADVDPQVGAGLDQDGAVLPVARLLELDLVPDVLACIDPSGQWLEREEVETAEDLASWHGRIQELLRRHESANAAIIDFHA
jgi:hypothetical protein